MKVRSQCVNFYAIKRTFKSCRSDNDPTNLKQADTSLKRAARKQNKTILRTINTQQQQFS